MCVPRERLVVQCVVCGGWRGGQPNDDIHALRTVPHYHLEYYQYHALLTVADQNRFGVLKKTRGLLKANQVWPLQKYRRQPATRVLVTWPGQVLQDFRLVHSDSPKRFHIPSFYQLCRVDGNKESSKALISSPLQMMPCESNFGWVLPRQLITLVVPLHWNASYCY